MKKIMTSIDMHGRILIPSSIRKKYNLHVGERIILEEDETNIKIVNADHVVDEMHAIFTKNQKNKPDSIVDNFIKLKRKEFSIEEKRRNKGV